MNLVWKLLRQHISIGQFVGFFFANLFGMFIILLGFQFYRDVLPVFTSEDSFMKADYIIMSKKIKKLDAVEIQNFMDAYLDSVTVDDKYVRVQTKLNEIVAVDEQNDAAD